MDNGFCTKGNIINPKCYRVETFDFSSEESIFDVLLDVFKSELPDRMRTLKDCNGEPMYIAEKDIDIVPTPEPSHFSLILNPLGDVPDYSANLNFRTVEYNFELILSVFNPLPHCVTWELLKFKNAVEGLLLGTEFVIDGYNSVEVSPKGFTYFIPEADGGLFSRQGAYRFSVTVTQYRN